MPLSTYCGNTSIRYRVLYDTMENQRKFTYLNKEKRENISNLCENAISILAVVQICGVHRTTVWRVIKAKTEYRTKRGGRKRRISKLWDDLITLTVNKITTDQ